MLQPRRGQTVLLFLLGPITQQIPAQMPNLFYGLSFGLIGRATLGDGLIHHIGDLPQPRIGVRTLGKARIKTRFGWFGDGQFIIHLTALFIQWLNLYNAKISSTPVFFLPITHKHTPRAEQLVNVRVGLRLGIDAENRLGAGAAQHQP